MDINEQTISQIVRLVIKVLAEQGLLKNTGAGLAAPADEAEIQPQFPGRKLVVTEEMVRSYAGRKVKRIRVPAGSMITPLAKDTAREKGIDIVKKADS